MANAEAIDEEIPEKKGKFGLIVALVLALAAGGGGFFAAFSGMIPSGGENGAESAEGEEKPLKTLELNAYVPLDPLVVNIRSSSRYQLLRFNAQLEVKPEHQEEVIALKPRITDVMNTYLNALEAARFEDPVAMMKLRAQLLRRLQLITGEGRVEDLLIMEFVLQ